jgi:hypothetical protein
MREAFGVVRRRADGASISHDLLDLVDDLAPTLLEPVGEAGGRE